MEIEAKRNNKRIIFLILALICMITIFLFSNENGEESQKTSDKALSDIVIDTTMNIFPSADRNKVFLIVNFIVRKGAHFTLYTIIGLIIFGFVNTYELELKDKIKLTIMLGIIYAISDEIHQIFVPARTGQIKDVFIDTLGISFGTWIGCLIYKKRGEKIGRARHKTNSSSNME